MSETKKTQSAAVEPNYKAMYEQAMKELGAAQNKNVEYEKIIKSYAAQVTELQNINKQAMLEYNSRCDYMLDAVKHAYISIQLAYKGGKHD